MPPNATRYLVAAGLALGLMAAACRADDPPPRGKTARRPSASAARREPGGPPGCPLHKAKPAAPARAVRPAAGMPDMFARMGESFARNPAGGFFDFVQGLSDLEGPALDGVTLSPAEERDAGRKARAEYLRRAAERGYRVVEDRRKLAYLKDLVATFAARMEHRDRYPSIDVTLLDAPIAEGQAFPGGSILVTTALLDEPDEATVAGVVAHELAHLDLGHLYNYARRGKLAETTYGGMGHPNAGFDQFFTRQLALFGLMMNPYRPEDESQADCTAATWLFREGYDPEALSGFFERLHRRIGDRPADPDFAFGRSHPFSLDRRAHVRRRLDQLKKWRPKTELGLYAENLKNLEAKAPAAGPAQP